VGRQQQRRLLGALIALLVCVGVPAEAGQGGPDEYGHVWLDSSEPAGPAFAPEFSPTPGLQPLNMGTGLQADEGAIAITIGFLFSFYGEEYDRLWVHSNGGLSFGPNQTPLEARFFYDGTPTTGGSYAFDCEDLTWPAPIIAAYWTDLDPRPSTLAGNAGIYAVLEGVAPSRRLIIAWYQIPHYDLNNPNNNNLGKNQFEVKLFEEDGHIEVHYAVLAGGPTLGNGKVAAIGTGGSDHELLVSCGQAVINNNSAVGFYPQVCNDTDLDGACEWEDCDNSNSSVFPGATEACNGIDDNCDGQIDEHPATGERTWYPDQDGDNFGAAGASVPLSACEQPDGYAENSDDCNDLNIDIYPGAPELCDGLDNDCDPDTDEDGDEDGDGASPCGTPADCDDSDSTLNPNDSDQDGITSCNGDCNDTVDEIAPGFAELCDGYDNDCDGRTDENPECGDGVVPGHDIPYGCILSCNLAEEGAGQASKRQTHLALLLVLIAGLLRRRSQRLA